MKAIHLDLLDAIERQEMLSLTWGFVDGSMSRVEVIKLGQALVGDIDDSEDLLEELIDRRLVFELKSERIRSRFAETVRLISRLRQLFPGKPWQGAPRLVSDFRVDLRRRNYPNRNRPAIILSSEHSQILGATPLRKSLWNALAEKTNLTLAAFQERAILRLLSANPDTGTIVTAGTGSGKTLAFYLPALMRIGDLIRPNQYWVKALAIYPRTELLKDQLAETFRRARQIDGALVEHNKRPMLLGAYFGSTPNNASPNAIADKWERRGGAFVCPWFACPTCGNELIWRESDIAAEKERLVCQSTGCGLSIDDDQLVLTRKRLAVEPPDILFTTTEMLNQRMSDLRMRGLFGIGQVLDRKPLFALLDEVHTYAGTSGAQAALALRRWRHLVGAPVTWCGLSATLREAPRFFSDLTGVAPDKVAEVTPTTDELIGEGAEYQVVLRGDTTLQASLLSTSIQTAMLIGRMMDPGTGAHSDGKFGRRLFVFTDDLDVTNRLFDNLRDAEAYTIFGRPDGTRNPLAALRGNEPLDPRRDADGQRWRACEQIGRTLNARLVIGRTTSQDAGVLSGADVIVATAALEVGYNDDQVGAVLQHKSPRNMASFLQRKGRAGRVRGMRPLTVTALSDYGRDRVSFQAYEHLFDPALPPQHLPILNQYVLRMQAVFAFIDWLANDAADLSKSGWLWELLSKPDSNAPTSIRDHVKQKLAELVRGELPVLLSLQEHLKQSLRLPSDIVDSILWDPPRALLLEVVPTLVRRLFLDWKLAYPQPGKVCDFQVNYHPLPDFIPRSLFSDLSLPEVQVMLPPATQNDASRQEALPIVQALQQLAPGRVTRRFAFERGALCHWVAIDVDADEQSMSIDTYAEHHEALGVFDGRRDDGTERSILVYRPWTVRLSQARREVLLPTSNAFPVWYSGFLARGVPLVIGTPPRNAWFEYVSDVHFYLHRFRSSIAVRRFSPEIHANIRQSTGEKLSTIRFMDSDGRPSAVGFEIEVDGFHVDFRLPSEAELAALPLPAELVASNRIAYHRHRLCTDPGLPPEVNTLQREWLHQILVSAAIVRALQDNISVGEAATALLSDSPERAFGEVMKSLFVLQDIEADEGADEDIDTEENADQPVTRVSRLEERLTTSLARMDVLERLRVLAPELDVPEPKAYGSWLRQTLHETLAEALLQACINTAPRHAATDTLVSDFEVDTDSGYGRVWISETTLGGAGVIQAFADAFSSEPRALFRALEAALSPTDLELSSHGLKQFLTLACEKSNIAKLTEELRATVEHQDRNALREKLYELLAQHGLDVSHALSVSINTRLLRPGAGKEWDLLLLDLINSWEDIESRFALAIGVREFSYIALKLPGIRDRVIALMNSNQGAFQGDAELIQILSGLLWPRGIEIRQRALQSYNPFRTRRVTDPALVRTLLLTPNIPIVAIDDPDWLLALTKCLADQGSAQVQIIRSEERKLRSAIIEVLCRPVDVGYLQFFPVVERVERTETETKVTLSLREQV
jgi:hypothetical protein